MHDTRFAPSGERVNIVEEPISFLSRNFVPFVFFVAKSSMYKRCNSAFGVQATSLPRAEADSGCTITVRNEARSFAVRSWCGTKRGYLQSNITVRNGAEGGAVRLRYGTGWGLEMPSKFSRLVSENCRHKQTPPLITCGGVCVTISSTGAAREFCGRKETLESRGIYTVAR